jgi:RNA polymerase sigma factor (sigma-70 family)
MEDAHLLEQYVQTGSHEAFEGLVKRHVNFVHAAAMRHVHDPDVAEDVTQAVFMVLARKAATLRHEAVLSSWLMSTTRYAALSTMKIARRRRHHEKQVAEMTAGNQTTENLELQWQQLQEMLDAAMGKLREADRKAILLRFYERKSFAEIGRILGTAEDAARKRVSRAVDQLRTIFGKDGEVIPAVALGTLLFTKLAQVAPAELAGKITAAALAPAGAATGASADLARGIVHHLSAVKVRRMTALTCAMVLVLALGSLAATQMLKWHQQFDQPRDVVPVNVAVQK